MNLSGTDALNPQLAGNMLPAALYDNRESKREEKTDYLFLRKSRDSFGEEILKNLSAVYLWTHHYTKNSFY